MNRLGTVCALLLMTVCISESSAQEPSLFKSSAALGGPVVTPELEKTEAEKPPPIEELPQEPAPPPAENVTALKSEQPDEPVLVQKSELPPVQYPPIYVDRPFSFEDVVYEAQETIYDSGEFRAGAGIYLFWPQFSSNPAFWATSGNTSTLEHFGYGARVAPLFWLGYEAANGWGGRVRWFEFDQSADTIQFVHPGGDTVIRSAAPLGAPPLVASVGGQNVVIASGLDVDSWDFEITWSPKFGELWEFQLGLGGSYRYIFQDYFAYAGGRLPSKPKPQTSKCSFRGRGKAWGKRRQARFWRCEPPAASVSAPTSGGYGLSSERSFTGAGPTLSFELARLLGFTGLHVYTQGRCTFLFGDTAQTVVSQNIADNKIVKQMIFHSRHSDVIPVGEIEIGLGMERVLGRSTFMFRAGFVGQAWWGGGNAVYENSDFGFIGGTFRGGFRF